MTAEGNAPPDNRPLVEPVKKPSRRKKSKQTALMPGNGDRVGYWLTPPELMAKLQAEFGFTFDACPYPRPAGFDGLKEEWGERTWVNPPFAGSSYTAWVRKAIEEQEKGRTSVLILSVDRWWTYLVQAGAEMRILPPFRWLNPEGKPQKAPHPHLLFILRGKTP